jgi:hypothetical protein
VDCNETVVPTLGIVVKLVELEKALINGVKAPVPKPAKIAFWKTVALNVLLLVPLNNIPIA